ncbi:tripartite motif-containing protein 16-like [Polypterus senegalus]|uniref:tripartite motif-containing protein 16-like n=1 Tax=Polypterus senegalus TaxID=55291 RepID=UPI00196595BB|nr:tripartite motif-containing protein 16-like [Polypterus senegalus]
MPELNGNTTASKPIAVVAPFQLYAGPDDVPCDVCTERKLRAAKTCLTCLASYCETHLQPHRQSEALKRHKLEEPTGKLEEKLCKKHQEVLKLFCRTEETLICSMCVVAEHKGHDIVTPEEGTASRQSELEKRNKEMKKLEDKEKKPNDLETVTRTESSAERKLQEFKETLKFLPQSIERLWSHFTEVIEATKKREVRKDDELTERIKEKIKVLKSRDIELGSDSLQNLQSRDDLLKYFCPLTLHFSTAQRRLHPSEGNKKVTNMRKEFPYPDHPDRFENWPQVLCTEALSGARYYWEVEWNGEGVDIGVTYKGIQCKGWGMDCLLGHNDRSWCLYCSDSSHCVWHNNTKIDISSPPGHRIGVYLDCPEGSLSFYSISDSTTLLHRFNATFAEPLYPAFKVGANCSVTICPPDQCVQSPL